MSYQRPVTTVILAGGQASRMGGEKATRELRGLPLIEWVIGAIAPQDTDIIISANTNLDALARYGYPVVPDILPGFLGPLAGVHAAMHASGSDWVACVPCDTPFLPDDLIERLKAAAGDGASAVAVVQGEWHPAIAIYRRELHEQLERFLKEGGRKVGTWLESIAAREAKFDHADDFHNINTLDELESAQDKKIQ